MNPETLRNWVRAAGASRPRGHRAQMPTEPPTPLEAQNAALRKKVRELEEEREILRRDGEVFRRGDALVHRFQFVADHQRRYGVKRLCTILGIARSSFYYWCRTAADRAARQAADALLAARIRAVHRESDGTYGVPRITAELRGNSERINHKRIARVMRSIGLAGVRLRRRHRITIADPAASRAPDLIGRDFTASEPNTKYVGDITYLPVDGGQFLGRADRHSERHAGPLPQARRHVLSRWTVDYGRRAERHPSSALTTRGAAPPYAAGRQRLHTPLTSVDTRPGTRADAVVTGAACPVGNGAPEVSGRADDEMRC
ncbi:IS3 family transposase [Streptomyces olivaceoviridis]|uniref:IS3 family transposase n=1 Tax=Streptomyces olivaceoviridis TaxID=1921 RepID=UPI0037000147